MLKDYLVNMMWIEDDSPPLPEAQAFFFLFLVTIYEEIQPGFGLADVNLSLCFPHDNLVKLNLENLIEKWFNILDLV